jgi:hypothetical protein
MTPRLEGSPIGNQRGVLVSVSTIPAPCFLKNPISHLRVRAIAFGKALSNPETYRFPLERLERARNRSHKLMLFGKSNCHFGLGGGATC